MHKLLDTSNIKLTTDLKEDPTISEFDIQATYISSQTYANKSYTYGSQVLNFTLADIIGDQLGGLGGEVRDLENLWVAHLKNRVQMLRLETIKVAPKLLA